MKIIIKKIFLILLPFVILTILTTCGQIIPEIKDTTPPSVSSISPVNNATDVPVNTTITVTFSEAINTSTITTATFIVTTGGSNISGTVDGYSGTTVTFKLSNNLAYSTTYTVTITAADVKDAAGNTMASNYTWSFTTGSAPDTSPTVSTTSPAPDTTGVAINTTITATFSENMDDKFVTTETFTLKDNSNISVIGTVTYNDTIATFTPSNNLSYSTTYTATITTGVKDIAEIPLASTYVWSFTTLPLTPPPPPE